MKIGDDLAINYDAYECVNNELKLLGSKIHVDMFQIVRIVNIDESKVVANIIGTAQNIILPYTIASNMAELMQFIVNLP